jgi:hypothetical protein
LEIYIGYIQQVCNIWDTVMKVIVNQVSRKLKQSKYLIGFSIVEGNIQVLGPTLCFENLDGTYLHSSLHLCNQFLDTKSWKLACVGQYQLYKAMYKVLKMMARTINAVDYEAEKELLRL